MSYVDGFVLAVPTAKKQAYREHASLAWEVFNTNPHRKVCTSEGLTGFRARRSMEGMLDCLSTCYNAAMEPVSPSHGRG